MTAAAAPTVPRVPPPFVVRWSDKLARWLHSLARRMAPPQFALLEVVGARWVSDALGAFTRLGLPEQLAQGPKTAHALASRCDVDVDALHRLLRALAREGLLTETADGAFGLTAVTEPLRDDHPATMRNFVLNLTAEHNVRTWASLHRSVASGASVFADVVGRPDPWAWMADHPEHGEVFHGAMAELTRDVVPAVVGAYDFARHRSVCDLGGGRGILLAGLLASTPTLRGTLVDSADVVAEAPPVFARWQVADRATIEAGDAFTSIPSGHDLYVAKHLLHGYDDERLLPMLRAWREAMDDHARLLLVEIVVPGPGQPFMAMLDLQMLVSSYGGRERTEEEWRSLLGRGGFTLRAVRATASPFSVIEVDPA